MLLSSTYHEVILLSLDINVHDLYKSNILHCRLNMFDLYSTLDSLLLFCYVVSACLESENCLFLGYLVPVNNSRNVNVTKCNVQSLSHYQISNFSNDINKSIILNNSLLDASETILFESFSISYLLTLFSYL